MNEPEPLLPAGFRAHHFATVGSTNDTAKELARTGAPAGTLVWADAQTAGRGRRGRVWASPPGNLYMSLVLRPEGPPVQAAQLGFVAALALGDAIAALAGPGLRPRCKWPNDLLLNGKKLAGILLESEMAGERLDFVVIGVGVNIVSAPPGTEYPATSLAAEGVGCIVPASLLAAFAEHFGRWDERRRGAGFAALRAAWLERAVGLGEPVRVRLEKLTLNGRFLDLDEDGALVLEMADGRRRIAAGEVFPAASTAA